MSLLNLKSIFSPTNTKFQDNQSDLSTAPRQFDNAFQQSNLLNLKSTSQNDLSNNIEEYSDNSVIYPNTNLNYNDNQFIPQSFGIDVEINKPILDSVLRGRVYDQIQFSQNFTNENLFVGPEQLPFTDLNFKTETFDPRSTTPKERTLYFNTNRTMGTLQYGEGGFQANVPSLQNGITDFSTAAGNNDSPFIPLSQLGVQFFNGEGSDKNLSWETLYNSNHTPKDNPQWQAGGLSALHYGPNVSRDNLNIGLNSRIYGERSGFGGESRTSTEKKLKISALGGEIENLTDLPIGREPYVVSDIGGGRAKNRGGRFLPIERAMTDVDRISKFLQSPEGIAFLVRQNAYNLVNTPVIRKRNPFNPKEDRLYRVPQRFNTTLNPFQTLIAVGARGLGEGVPNIKIRKGGLDLPLADLIPGATREYGPSNTSAAGGLFNSGFSINDTFTAGTSGKKGLFGNIGSAIQSVATNVPGLSSLVPLEKTYLGDEVTLQGIVSGDEITVDQGGTRTVTVPQGTGRQSGKQITVPTAGTLAAAIGLGKDNSIPSPAKEKHGMPFYFKDLRDNSYIFFRAYIEGMTENVSPSYATTNYIGRSEPVYTYERAEREINFTLKLVSQTEDELDMIYTKMNHLTSLCYPEYMVDEYGNRMKPPLTKLRYGELYGKTNKEQLGYIKSISYTVEQSSPYETKVGKRVPKHIMATIAYQVIHSKVPSKNTKFYGIRTSGDF